MVPRADRHAAAIENRADIVRMDAVEHERQDARLARRRANDAQARNTRRFLRRVREATHIASERVREKFGYACSRAHDQLGSIEEQAARYADDPVARVRIVAFAFAVAVFGFAVVRTLMLPW